MQVINYYFVGLFYTTAYYNFDCTASTSNQQKLILSKNQTLSVQKSSDQFSSNTFGSNHNINYIQNKNTGIHSIKLSTKNNINLNQSLDDLQFLLTNLGKDVDDLKDSDENIRNIYDGVVGLLLLKIQNWLSTSQNLQLIAKYLGFDNYTIHLINRSLTQLFYLQNRGKIHIANLMNVFFYSCDIENIIQDHTEHTKKNVVEQLSLILRTLQSNKNNSGQLDEIFLVKSLISSMAQIDKKPKTAFSVTISLMKNRVYVYYSKPTALSKDSFVKKNQDFIELTKEETDGRKIVENHVNFLGKIIPDIFGLMYNHLELLSNIKILDSDFNIKNGIDTERKIESFSQFLNLFKEIMLSRYIEFKYKKEIDQDFENLLNQLINKLSFKDSSVSIFADDEYYESTWDSLNNVLEKILFYTDVNSNIEDWKKQRTLKMDFIEGNNSIEYYLNLIKINTEDANDILSTFAANFSYDANMLTS